MFFQCRSNPDCFQDKIPFKFIIITLVIFLLSLSFLGCIKGDNGEDDIDYDVIVKFVDSTYEEDKQFYMAGDSIYIYAQEYFDAQMPDTVEIKIACEEGDTEYIKAWSKGHGSAPIPEIRTHSGSIKSTLDTNIILDNGILEVKEDSTLIISYYNVEGQTVQDSAWIVINSEEGK